MALIIVPQFSPSLFFVCQVASRFKPRFSCNCGEEPSGKDLLKETVDKENKRSKRLSITKKGVKVLGDARNAIGKVAATMYGHMTGDDRQLCTRLLTPTLAANAKEWHGHKGFESPMP